MTTAWPLFGGTFDPDPAIRQQQDDLLALAAEKQWSCGDCGCARLCRQAQRNRWLWRKAVALEAAREAAKEGTSQ